MTRDSKIIKNNNIEEAIKDKENNINNSINIQENKELITSNPLIQSIKEERDKMRYKKARLRESNKSVMVAN